MTPGPNGRVPVEVKTIVTVVGVVLSLGVTWGLFNGRMARAEEKLADHGGLLQSFDAKQDTAREAAIVINGKVDTLAAQVNDVQIEQKTQGEAIQELNQQVFQQSFVLQKILEEVKKQ